MARVNLIVFSNIVLVLIQCQFSRKCYFAATIQYLLPITAPSSIIITIIICVCKQVKLIDGALFSSHFRLLATKRLTWNVHDPAKCPVWLRLLVREREIYFYVFFICLWQNIIMLRPRSNEEAIVKSSQIFQTAKPSWLVQNVNFNCCDIDHFQSTNYY